jgi:diguanylate cyclase (GGDEF)-like protein
LVTVNGLTTSDFDARKHRVLNERISPEDTNAWFFERDLAGWFCAYKPLTDKQFALFISITDPSLLIDEDYIQLLFSFYCHQLRGLESSYRDSLTGLYNRRAFDQRIAALFNSQHRPRRRHQFTPSAFAMLDIDHFKQINDKFGHLYGDEVLAIVAKIMTDSFRDYDLLFRYGGEEFSAVLMEIDPEGVHDALDRFRQRVEQNDFPRHNRVTVSIGYTEFDLKATPEALIDRADKALYFSKHSGRNQVCLFTD